MRVIAGEFRRRVLKSVPGLDVRPTPDRLRESLFSILAPRIEGTVFIDAYAGSGAVGIEALSRGASHVILMERSPTALTVIRENLAALGIANRVTVLRGKAVALLPEHAADIVFIDPPYEQVNEYLDSLLALADMRCPLVIAQHPSRLKLEESYGVLTRTRALKQGDNSLTFYEPLSTGEQDIDIHNISPRRTGLQQIAQRIEKRISIIPD
jgi:16S rRNA (guanine(966)-N(2))-methyltransferase RsmD